MKIETKACLTILIREIQDCKDIEEIKKMLDIWIKANDLHPEQVQTYNSLEELKKALR